MGKLRILLIAIAVFGIAVPQAEASIVFSFSESGGNVLMQSSGVLDTSKLVSISPSGYSGWGDRGIETNSPPESDIMGDTTMGSLDTWFAFNVGTDLSPWIGNMFTVDHFGWATAGTTQFATYYRNPNRTPGLGISAADLVGNLWTPDVSWSTPGTFASLGMTVGDYTITDSRTNESISIQIRSVPEPGTIALLGLGLAGLGASRRRRKTQQAH